MKMNEWMWTHALSSSDTNTDTASINVKYTPFYLHTMPYIMHIILERGHLTIIVG